MAHNNSKIEANGNGWSVYMMQGILYIERVLKAIVSLRPYLDQYGPMLQQFAVLYKAMKLIQQEGHQEDPVIEQTHIQKPTLYI